MTNPDTPDGDDDPGRHAADEAPPGLLERWNATEPVRVALWPVAVAVVALFTGYGLLTAERAQLWLALVVAVVGGGLPLVGAAVARHNAWAPATVRRTVDEWREYEYGSGFDDATELAKRATPAPELPSTVESPEARPEPVHPPTAQIRAQRRGVPPSTT